MYLTMFREESVGKATLSKLFNGLIFLCDVLEDEVREIEGVPVADWKVHGATAIPHGKYKVVLEDSQRFGPDTPTLLDVPGYKYIRCHSGNKSEDTEGCLLFGIKSSSNTVSNSRVTVATIKMLMLEAVKKGETIEIEIFPFQKAE